MAHPEHWKEIAEQVAVEKDPIHLMELVHELNALLLDKERQERGLTAATADLPQKNDRHIA